MTFNAELIQGEGWVLTLHEEHNEPCLACYQPITTKYNVYFCPDKERLKQDFEVEFNELYTITNLPISRFMDYLFVIGKYEEYMEILADSFNPDAAEKVMCRSTISVGWDGELYDCDFNQMLSLPIKGKSRRHISNFNEESLIKRNIVVNQHCFGCTAGAGSSCQGAIV